MAFERRAATQGKLCRQALDFEKGWFLADREVEAQATIGKAQKREAVRECCFA